MRCALRACDKRHPAHKAYRLLRGVVQRDVARFPRTVRDYITLSRRSSLLAWRGPARCDARDRPPERWQRAECVRAVRKSIEEEVDHGSEYSSSWISVHTH